MNTPRRPELDFQATVPALSRRGAELFGDKTLINTDGVERSYRDIEAESRRLAKTLIEAGVGKGTRVAAQFPYGAEWVVAWIAATRIGALFIPLSTALKPAELQKILRHSDAHLLLMPPRLQGASRVEFLEQALPGLASSGPRLMLEGTPYLRSILLAGKVDQSWAQPISIFGATTASPVSDALLDDIESEVSPADLMIVIYTSGTTSAPKGVAHSHGAMVRHGANLAALLEFKHSDKIYCGMPFFWVGGVSYTMVPIMHVGGTLLCNDTFDAGRALDFMEHEQATLITGWPGITGPILKHPSMPTRNIPALTHPFLAPGKKSPHGQLGMTETCASHSGTTPETRWMPTPPGPGASMGHPVPHVEHKITDVQTGADLPEGEEGAIMVRGYSLMMGMIKREREDVFTPDGWYNTGDRGCIRQGVLFLTGRISEMIKTSGNNVAPPEVEGVLLRLGAQEAYVMGLPDADRGEIVASAVVLPVGAGIDADTLREKARAELSNYKVPRKIVFLNKDDIPWLATGKVDRLSLKAMVAALPNACTVQESSRG